MPLFKKRRPKGERREDLIAQAMALRPEPKGIYERDPRTGDVKGINPQTAASLRYYEKFARFSIIVGKLFPDLSTREVGEIATHVWHGEELT